MKKVLLAVTITSAMLTSACGFTPIYEPGEPAFDFVGCHTVKVNPSTTGERAFIAMFDLNVGDNLYFKQVNSETLKIGKVQTATPCD